MESEQTRQANIRTRLFRDPRLIRSPHLAWLRPYFAPPIIDDVFEIGLGQQHDPLLEAIIGRTRERAKTSAQLVTLGTLSYLHPDEFPYCAERYIPVDIYLEETDVATLVEIDKALGELFETLGLEYISYPAVVTSSARTRAVVKTAPMTPVELREMDSRLGKGLQLLDGEDEEDSTEDVADWLEIAKKQEELKLIKQQTKTSKAEEKKLDAERAAAVMDKRNKLASLLLKAAGAVSITIGTVVLVSGSGDQGKAQVSTAKVEKTIQTHEAGRAHHLKELGEFLKKVAEQGKEESEGE